MGNLEFVVALSCKISKYELTFIILPHDFE